MGKFVMLANNISLTTASKSYKPFRYNWAFDFYKQQQRIHWLPEEITLSEDIKDWNKKLTKNEKEFLTHIFRFFTQSDIDVAEGYVTQYLPYFKPVEIRMMLSAFANMESVHIEAYALLIETLGMPEVEFSRFMDYQVMVDKHNWISNRKNIADLDDPKDILFTIGAYGALTEGLQLFASFAMLLNFPRQNKMKNMGQIITWSVRDESLHCEGISYLFKEFAKEHNIKLNSRWMKEKFTDIVKQAIKHEDKFIDLAFSGGNIPGIKPLHIKRYIRYIADWRLKQFGFNFSLYNIDNHPLPWLRTILYGVEHANFFETRATEYSKGSTEGSWDNVWNNYKFE